MLQSAGGFVCDKSKMTALAVVSIRLSDNMADFMDDVNSTAIVTKMFVHLIK